MVGLVVAIIGILLAMLYTLHEFSASKQRKVEKNTGNIPNQTNGKKPKKNNIRNYNWEDKKTEAKINEANFRLLKSVDWGNDTGIKSLKPDCNDQEEYDKLFSYRKRGTSQEKSPCGKYSVLANRDIETKNNIGKDIQSENTQPELELNNKFLKNIANNDIFLFIFKLF